MLKYFNYNELPNCELTAPLLQTVRDDQFYDDQQTDLLQEIYAVCLRFNGPTIDQIIKPIERLLNATPLGKNNTVFNMIIDMVKAMEIQDCRAELRKMQKVERVVTRQRYLETAKYSNCEFDARTAETPSRGAIFPRFYAINALQPGAALVPVRLELEQTWQPRGNPRYQTYWSHSEWPALNMQEALPDLDDSRLIIIDRELGVTIALQYWSSRNLNLKIRNTIELDVKKIWRVMHCAHAIYLSDIII